MTDYSALARQVRLWGHELGFQAVGITDTGLDAAGAGLRDWLSAGCHGEMDYMARHVDKRVHPERLHPGTLRVISARMDYWPQARAAAEVLADGRLAYVSRYALGRDYHKVIRNRLARLADRLAEAAGKAGHRVFCDSAPVLEVALAGKAGLGWRGKHTLLLSREGGSCFFLGEIFTDLPLPVDEPQSAHCGKCERCIDACPTRAIVGPYRLDARRCISYLTIEHKGSIPEDLRSLIGNRVYGCDDCQLVCPWNSFARPGGEADFQVRNGLDEASLCDLFSWSSETFEARLAGSPIRRIGYERWLRNLAVGLGNAPCSAEVESALQARADHPSALVREHVQWALAQHRSRRGPAP